MLLKTRTSYEGKTISKRIVDRGVTIPYKYIMHTEKLLFATEDTDKYVCVCMCVCVDN